MAHFWMPALGLITLFVFIYILFFSRRAGRKTLLVLVSWVLLMCFLVLGLFFPITNFVQNESGVGVYQVVNDHKLKDFTTQGDLSGGQILPRSFDLSTGLQRGGILMGVLSICALLYWTAGREMIRKLLLVFFLNGLILSILGIAVQVSGSSKMLWLFDSSNTHFFSTFHYHNNWGAFCILSLCSGLALSNYHLRRRHPEKSNNPWLFFLIMSMFLLATLPLARGRVSICAGIIILLALLIWALRRWKGLGSIFKNLGTSYPRKIGILIGVSALITFLWNILWKDPVLERLQDTEVQVASFLNDNGNYRTWGWQHTPRMALDRPYWGWGLGSYKWVFNQEYAGSEFQKYSKKPPLHLGFAEYLESDKPRTHEFKPLLNRFTEGTDFPEGFTYSIHHNRPLRFEWDSFHETWNHHTTEVTFSARIGKLLLDERTVSVSIDQDSGILKINHPEIPSLPNWNFQEVPEVEVSSQSQSPIVSWQVERSDINTTSVSDYVLGKSIPAGDGRSTTLSYVPESGRSGKSDAFLKVQMGKYDSNSIWANYLNGPFFRLVSPQIGLVEGEWYSFLVWSRLIESGPDPYDPPVLALETGPPVNNRMQEHILGQVRAGKRWNYHLTNLAYQDYGGGRFSIRRSSKQGKAAGALIGIDDVEVFHHEQVSGIGVSVSGDNSEKLRLNFLYRGIFHPVELDVVGQGQGAVGKWANNHAHNDYLEFWAELGGFGCLLLLLPVLFFLSKAWFDARSSTPRLLFLVASGSILFSLIIFWELFGWELRLVMMIPMLIFLISEWWIVRSSIARWLFLGCFIVAAMGIVDFPLQNPVVFCLFSICLTIAGKYTMIQTRNLRAKANRA